MSISKNVSYKQYELINFKKLSQDQTIKILEWRNDDRIRKYMHTQRLISFDEHFKYIKSINKTKDSLSFLVKQNEVYLGVIRLLNINNDSCEIALYKNPKENAVGNILMDIIYFVAKKILRVEKLQLSVLENNPKAIHLYKKYGFHTTLNRDNVLYMEKKLYKNNIN